MLLMHLFLKILSGMANSVDPDQTAPEGSALFAYVILSETLVFEVLEHLPYTEMKPGEIFSLAAIQHLTLAIVNKNKFCRWNPFKAKYT